MKTFFKTYISAAPWRAILLYGLIFATLVGGIQVLVRYKNSESYTSGSWLGELAMWYIAGMFTKYVTWRAEGALERRNTRWKASRKSHGTK